MFHATHARRFFKSYRHLPSSNPMRRWVPHKYFAGALGTIVAVPFISYIWTGSLDDNRIAPDSFAGAGVQTYMEVAPLNAISRSIGVAASSTILPAWLHQKLIGGFIWLYAIDPSQFVAASECATLQDYFTRRLSQPRVLEMPEGVSSNSASSSNSNGKYMLHSPCDAEVLECGPLVGNGLIPQVKGHTYPVNALMRTTMPDPAPGYDRHFAVFHLRPCDYHRVHSPTAMKVLRTVHVPGVLYPTTYTATRWLPGIYLSNERVVYDGPSTTDPKAHIGVALVGATCVGRIKVAFDGRVSTNTADAPETTIRREYGAAAPLVRAGEEVGHFEWGSTVVLVADLPKGVALRLKPHQEVRQGQLIAAAE